MLNFVIQFALNNRLMILATALVVIVAGGFVASSLPIDVLPRPHSSPRRADHRMPWPRAGRGGAAGDLFPWRRQSMGPTG